jgi:hypothetical protein
MSKYNLPKIKTVDSLPENTAVLVASGDLRLSANQECWPVQKEMEEKLAEAFSKEGITIKRGHAYDPNTRHGFISTQRMGIEIFKKIPKDCKLIVAESVWQFSSNILAGLRDHQGPILTVANFDGQWPGLVGLLNLNASLTKMGVPYSTIWSRSFTDEFFVNGIRQWLREGKIDHDLSHVSDLFIRDIPEDERALGQALAQQLLSEKAIMGIFDEGCMGMYNAFFDDELLNVLGIYKERLSQSALLAEMGRVEDEEAFAAYNWLKDRGVAFELGSDPTIHLTETHVIEQMKMYIAAVRMAHFFGCDLIGIQYQLGLKDMAPASDLVEGLLNNVDRPPVFEKGSKVELFPGRAVVHFNEVDEGAGVDALVTNRVWNALGFSPETTLHDVRYGERYSDNGLDDFVWVFEISGSVPPAHLEGGYEGAISKRQDRKFFPLGGGTLSGVCKAGEIVWSRVYQAEDGKIHADIGRGSAVKLPDEETQRRLKLTNEEWPIMNAVLHGISRDQMMARNKSNHVNVAYAPSPEAADRALWAKAAMLLEMGVNVHVCGEVNI